MTFLEALLYALSGRIPYVAVAVFLSIVGWRRLRMNHRKAAVWLISGMATFAAYWVLGAVSVAYTNVLMVQARASGGARTDVLPMVTMLSLVVALFLIFSLICFAMAAMSGRRDPVLAVAPSNNSLQRP